MDANSERKLSVGMEGVIYCKHDHKNEIFTRTCMMIFKAVVEMFKTVESQPDELTYLISEV